MIGIYKIYNKLTPNKVYIGQSINMENRRRSHLHKLRLNKHHNSHLQNSFNKNGEDSITFEVITECTQEVLHEKEVYYIELYNSYKNGYNMTSGGESRPTDNPETRKKISATLTGKKLSESHIEQIKKGKIGLKVYGMCIAQYTLNMELINVYESINKASDNANITASYLGRVLKWDNPSKGGFIWKYISKDDYHTLEKSCNVEKIKCKYERVEKGIVAKTGDVETYYRTITECSILLNTSQSTIIRSLQGKVKNNRMNYTFKYVK